MFLLAHDTDAFSRWEAAQQLAMDAMLSAIRTISFMDSALFLSLTHCFLIDEEMSGGRKISPLEYRADDAYIEAMASVLNADLIGASYFSRKGLSSSATKPYNPN